MLLLRALCRKLGAPARQRAKISNHRIALIQVTAQGGSVSRTATLTITVDSIVWLA